MPKLSDHPSALTTKLLFIGDSGAGKTGALASLADARYNIRIIDVDNGADVLTNLLKDPKAGYSREALDRVNYQTFTDKMKLGGGGKLIPGKATVWQRAITQIDHWKEVDAEGKVITDLGPLTDWTPNDVLVIDSLSFLAKAALNFVLSMNNRLGGQIEQSHWYQGQQMLEGLCEMLYDESVKCNVIVTSHIAYIGPDNMEKGYANSLGKALSPKLGRYFNTILQAKTTGQGSAQKRKILTNTSGTVELKNSAPTRVKAEYPLETGLADYFRDIRTTEPK